MLLEFRLANSVAEKSEPKRPLFVLMNQLVGVHEPPAYASDPLAGEVRRCVVSLRSGQCHEVAESVEDVLDAMKFATRHIGVTPGIADKVDGESEEVYPWRRGEKVTELARKWREHEKAKQNAKSHPFATPPLPPKQMPPGLPPLTREGVSPLPSPPPSPTESSGEAPSAGCATSEPTSGSSEASNPAPR